MLTEVIYFSTSCTPFWNETEIVFDRIMVCKHIWHLDSKPVACRFLDIALEAEIGKM